MGWTRNVVLGVANPVCTGVGPFPRLVEDAAWVRACAKLIEEEGPQPFLVNLLYVLRESRGIDGMKVTTTYLQMFVHPQRVVPPPREGLTVVHAKKPPVAYYRFLYDAVGRDYDWTSRRKLSDTELAALLNDPRLEVHVLTAEGVPAGFAELDRRIEGEIELVQFGLMPEFIGQGLGRYFLQWTIDKAWSYQPKRFWLHTCSKDHPAALPNYRKAGFAIYKEEVKDQG